MNIDFPKVLVVTNSGLRASGNFGLTMASLFQGWPDAKMANLHVGPPASDGRICTNSLNLEFEGVVGYRMGKALFRHLRSPERQAKDNAHGNANAKSLDPRTTLNSYGVLRGFADMLPLRIGAPVWKWVRQLSPDMVLSPLESIRIMKLSTAVSKVLRVPVVPFFADDWISTLYADSPLLLMPRLCLLLALRGVLRRTSIGMAGSPALASEYTKTFKKTFATFLHAVDVPADYPAPPVARRHSGIVIMYAGRLNCDRWQSLVDVGNALTVVRDSGLVVRLDVYSLGEDLDLYGARVSMPPFVNICGSLQPNDVFAKLLESDILLHVESFTDVQRQYTRLSLSTKIPQYLAAGRPILMYGPAEIAVTKYVAASAAGVIVDRNGIKDLASAIASLTVSKELRERLGRTGWILARESHDSEAVRHKCRTFLASCLQPERSVS
jgi:glycosyltransferase involved in cell wall biosynthesis